MDYELKNKKILVMGLGLHGGGLAVVKWLIKHKAKVTVTDLKTKKELASSLSQIPKNDLLKVKLVLGRHQVSDFKKADILVQNPGVPKKSKYLKIARQAGIKIENDASLFFKNCPAPIIGVTGTRGKSTTATLISEFLKASNRQVWLAGLPQKPMMAIVDQIGARDWVVLELSSWQLEILGEQRLSPQIAVFTNIYPDHLNRYKNINDYIKAKENLLIYQTKDDKAIINFDNKITKKIGQKVVGHRFWFSKKYLAEQNACFTKNNQIIYRFSGQEKKLFEVNQIKLKGKHNLENILAATAVAQILGVSPAKIKSVIKTFAGLANRIELIRAAKGIKYINDTTATTPQATIAALKTINKKVILVAGGSSKNIPLTEYKDLAKIIKQKTKGVILLKGDGSQQLISQLKKLKIKPIITNVKTMVEAVGLAQSLSKKGDIVLLSPACASFGLFVNEFDRGEQFRQIVKSL